MHREKYHCIHYTRKCINIFGRAAVIIRICEKILILVLKKNDLNLGKME